MDDVIISIVIHVVLPDGKPHIDLLNINWTGFLCDDMDLPPRFNPDTVLRDIAADVPLCAGDPSHYVAGVRLLGGEGLPELLARRDDLANSDFAEAAMHLYRAKN